MLRVLHVADGGGWGGIETHLLAHHKAAQECNACIALEFAFCGGEMASRRFTSAGAVVHTMSGTLTQRSWALRRVLRERRISIVHAHGYLAAHLAMLASIGLPVRRVVTLHAAVDRSHGPTERVWWFNRSARMVPLLLGARFIAVADAVRLDYVRRGLPARRITVVLNGYPCEPGRLIERKGGPVVGAIGRLVPVKNHALFLEAIRVARESCPGLRAVIAGDGPLRAALSLQARRLGIDESVDFVGWSDRVLRVLEQLDVLVFSSDSEGIPYTLLEAMCAGVPVVARAVGGLPEAIEHQRTGLLVPEPSPRALAKQVLRVLTEPGLRDRLRREARAEVGDRLSARRMLRETLRVYQSAPQAELDGEGTIPPSAE